MRRIALILEYEGTAYAGFQRQSNAASIQSVLEQALESLTGQAVRVKAAGRTDAGVHAAGQVVAFETDSALGLDRFREGTNFYLPEDIAVKAAYEAPAGFDPRRHAISRLYRYTMLVGAYRPALLRRSVYQVKGPLLLEQMAQCLQYLEGTRDFAPFSGPLPPDKSTVRQLYRGALHCEGELVHLDVEGNAFLPQQVRRMAGAVLQVGLDKMTVGEFEVLADSGQRGAARWVLPPQGLCLMEVRYRDFPPHKVGK